MTSTIQVIPIIYSLISGVDIAQTKPCLSNHKRTMWISVAGLLKISILLFFLVFSSTEMILALFSLSKTQISSNDMGSNGESLWHQLNETYVNKIVGLLIPFFSILYINDNSVR
jgi:hypothetical protein